MGWFEVRIKILCSKVQVGYLLVDGIVGGIIHEGFDMLKAYPATPDQGHLAHYAPGDCIALAPCGTLIRSPATILRARRLRKWSATKNPTPAA